jgi:transposase
MVIFMPYKNEYEHLKLPRKHDARVKLTLEDKERIKELYGSVSQRKLAAMFGVSRALIRWYGDPEKHRQNLLRRAERGGSRIYYDKKKQTVATRNCRRKRQELYKKGELIEENKGDYDE